MSRSWVFCTISFKFECSFIPQKKERKNDDGYIQNMEIIICEHAPREITPNNQTAQDLMLTGLTMTNTLRCVQSVHDCARNSDGQKNTTFVEWRLLYKVLTMCRCHTLRGPVCLECAIYTQQPPPGSHRQGCGLRVTDA